MKRIVSILFTLCFLGCMCLYAQKAGEYPISENRDMAMEISVCSRGNMDEPADINTGSSELREPSNFDIPSVQVLSEKEADKETLKEQAVLAYHEFLEGRRGIGNRMIDSLTRLDGEPTRYFLTEYAIVDSNGDDIPELNLKLPLGELVVISFEDGELIWLKSIERGSGRGYLLSNGAYMYCSEKYSKSKVRHAYVYFELDESGLEINHVRFSRDEKYGNDVSDKEEEFYFDDVICRQEEWFAKTREYLYTDENGREEVRNQAEWKLYFEGYPVEINDQVIFEQTSKGHRLTLYDKEHGEILSESYPKDTWIAGVSEDVLEIVISVGSPARYTFYFNRETAEISDTFFNAKLFGDKYIAYMEDRTLILSDIFKEGILYQEITRDFSETADPMSAIISVEMIDSENIRLEYYRGEEFAVEEEIIWQLDLK